jgi:hypothetical protein
MRCLASFEPSFLIHDISAAAVNTFLLILEWCVFWGTSGDGEPRLSEQCAHNCTARRDTIATTPF